MAEEIQRVRRTAIDNDGTVETSRTVMDHEAGTEHAQNVASRVIWFVAGVLLTLLGFRFLLALLGANLGNSFVGFVFDVTHPFISPFMTMFRYSDYVAGAARVEIFTLVAMLFYGLLAWGLARLATITNE